MYRYKYTRPHLPKKYEGSDWRTPSFFVLWFMMPVLMLVFFIGFLMSGAILSHCAPDMRITEFTLDTEKNNLNVACYVDNDIKQMSKNFEFAVKTTNNNQLVLYLHEKDYSSETEELEYTTIIAIPVNESINSSSLSTSNNS